MFSLIVATIGRVAELERLLASLEVQSCRDFEVIVVDQNSDDRLVPLLARHSGLTMQHLRSAAGLSRARNAGLRIARGDIVAIPDDDCWYPRDLLAAVKDWFASHPQFGLLGTATRTAENRLSGPNSPPTPRVCTRQNVWSCAVSTALFMRSSVSASVGDFNQNIGVGAASAYQSGEETDYILRAFERGFAMWYEPALTVHHPSLQLIARLRKTTYSFALGTGCVLRLHRYPLRQVGNQLLRSLGGAVVSLCAGNPSRAQVYMLRGTGLFMGYLSAGRAQKTLAPSAARE